MKAIEKENSKINKIDQLKLAEKKLITLRIVNSTCKFLNTVFAAVTTCHGLIYKLIDWMKGKTHYSGNYKQFINFFFSYTKEEFLNELKMNDDGIKASIQDNLYDLILKQPEITYHWLMIKFIMYKICNYSLGLGDAILKLISTLTLIDFFRRFIS